MGCLQQPTTPSGLMVTPVSPPAALSSGLSLLMFFPVQALHLSLIVVMLPITLKLGPGQSVGFSSK